MFGSGMSMFYFLPKSCTAFSFLLPITPSCLVYCLLCLVLFFFSSFLMNSICVMTLHCLGRRSIPLLFFYFRKYSYFFHSHPFFSHLSSSFSSSPVFLFHNTGLGQMDRIRNLGFLLHTRLAIQHNTHTHIGRGVRF
jgi:hypothetical protein